MHLVSSPRCKDFYYPCLPFCRILIYHWYMSILVSHKLWTLFAWVLKEEACKLCRIRILSSYPLKYYLDTVGSILENPANLICINCFDHILAALQIPGMSHWVKKKSFVIIIRRNKIGADHSKNDCLFPATEMLNELSHISKPFGHQRADFYLLWH